MHFLRFFVLNGLLCLPLCGCGGRPEVAAEPEAAPQELTPEEEAGERAYTQSREYRGR